MIIGLFLRSIKTYRQMYFIPVAFNNQNKMINYIGDNGVGKSSILEGLDSLKGEIIKMFSLDMLEETDTFLANNRQLTCANKALEALLKIRENIKSDLPLELIEIDLQEVLNELGTITGEVYDEELLDTLFENFCVGK